ncbi:MAG: sensor domain-containing diguanylate cyclase [Planctomycetes bacterium]|nr:sensor domain-containing diguanylate cyclase [Planctomycetota bacterium]
MTAFRHVRARETLEELRDRLGDLEVFHEVGKALTQTLDLREVLNTILQKVSDVIRPQTWSLLLVDEETQELYFKIAVGPRTEGLATLRLKIGEGIAGHVASTGEPLLVEDVSQDPRWSRKADERTQFETRSIVCVPLTSQGQVLGVLQLVNFEEARRFTDADLAVLQIFADFTAIAIRNARSMSRIAELSVKDDLTELFNSRYLNHALTRHHDAARRHNQPFSVVFLDLDKFKQVNDTHGHHVGDELLREVARLIADQLDPRAEAVRYGGDEFVVLLPEQDKQNALAFANRLRDSMTTHRFLERHLTGFQLSASIGLASYPEDAETPEQLMQRADQAMYHVKSTGRGNVATA